MWTLLVGGRKVASVQAGIKILNGQRQGQVHRRRRLSDTALSRRDRNDVTNVSEGLQVSLDPMRGDFRRYRDFDGININIRTDQFTNGLFKARLYFRTGKPNLDLNRRQTGIDRNIGDTTDIAEDVVHSRYDQRPDGLLKACFCRHNHISQVAIRLN